MRLLITDLDNTLYDWVTFFARAFDAMVNELVLVLCVEREALLDEFKVIHQRYGNSEQPFAALELPSVEQRFRELSVAERAKRLQPAFDAFKRERSRHLRLYPGVEHTLRELVAQGVTVVAHTEAIAVNAYYRLRLLGVDGCFRRLYALEGHIIPHPDPVRAAELSPRSDFIRLVPKAERKPNPTLLLDICRRERVAPENAVYVGDSLTRDIAMAMDAGVTSVWARYGINYDRRLWETLVRVTHWTDEDVAREAQLGAHAHDIAPNYTVDSYDEILDLFNLSGRNMIPATRRA